MNGRRKLLDSKPLFVDLFAFWQVLHNESCPAVGGSCLHCDHMVVQRTVTGLLFILKKTF